MRGKLSRDASTLMNLIDGIFAVAITLIPASLASQFPEGGGPALIRQTAYFVVCAVMMLLLWHKVRVSVQLKKHLGGIDLSLLCALLAVVVLVPKTAYLAMLHGDEPGSISFRSDAFWINLEYSCLILIVELLVIALTVSALNSPRAQKHSREAKRWVLGTELAGFAVFAVFVLAENLFTGINGVYIYAAPIVLLFEEISCTWRLRREP